jgi:hypothetical protein
MSADEHYRYVLLLEEQNAQMRAMVQARDTTIKSINAEVVTLRTALAKAGETTDALHRELDLSRATLRVVRAAVVEHRDATLGDAPPSAVVFGGHPRARTGRDHPAFAGGS